MKNAKIKPEINQTESLNLSFDFVKINLASPDKIEKWAKRRMPLKQSFGEVFNPSTISTKKKEPEEGGLFCPKIFGPIKNWRCSCGKYQGILVGKVCEVCNVELTESRVRRYRMGYINLASPITHFWYMQSVPNYLKMFLQVMNGSFDEKKIDEIIYYKGLECSTDDENILNKISKKDLLKKDIEEKNCVKEDFSEEKDDDETETFHTKPRKFRTFGHALEGSDLILSLLESISLRHSIGEIKRIISLYDRVGERAPFLRVLRLLENFRSTNTKPSWLVLTKLPVLPPSLRPFVETENSKLIAADANELYKNVLVQNNRILETISPEKSASIMQFRQCKKMLQMRLDCLIDNAHLPTLKQLCLNDVPLKGLTEGLEGKEGRFRHTLLGKRVDYSGRSVIISGPGLRLDQCGIPYGIAVEIFKPYLMNALHHVGSESSDFNTKTADFIIKTNQALVWRMLEVLMKKNYVLLNRAPTLHKFGIQAFQPVLVLGKAIHLHPLVCSGFNADFDGDQMAVHLPLYGSSQLEAHSLMRPSGNILSPSNGNVILKPAQDMVIGSYYLSLMHKNKLCEYAKYFGSAKEAIAAFYSKKLKIHDNILVKQDLFNSLKLLDNKLILVSDLESLCEQKIKILKKIKNKSKIYIFTNIGLIVGFELPNKLYKLSSLYIETTPGRLIFCENINSIFNIFGL